MVCNRIRPRPRCSPRCCCSAAATAGGCGCAPWSGTETATAACACCDPWTCGQRGRIVLIASGTQCGREFMQAHIATVGQRPNRTDDVSSMLFVRHGKLVLGTWANCVSILRLQICWTVRRSAPGVFALSHACCAVACRGSRTVCCPCHAASCAPASAPGRPPYPSSCPSLYPSSCDNKGRDGRDGPP